MEVEVRLLKQPELRKPCIVSGLPGIAYVGKLSVDHLVQTLHAELFGEVYSKFFPPYVLIGKDGIVELLRNELYFWKNKESERDLIFFTGNAQAVTPEGQYLMADKVLDTAMRLGAERIYSVAAFVTDRVIDTPRVYGAATEEALIDEFKRQGVLVMEEGPIGGVNGLIFGLAKVKKLQGVCLLGETYGYTTVSGQYLVDANAGRAVLEVLSKMLNVKVDLSPLDRQVEQMKEAIKRMAEIEEYAIKKTEEAAAKGYKNYIT